jgi:hypothetical protein
LGGKGQIKDSFFPFGFLLWDNVYWGHFNPPPQIEFIKKREKKLNQQPAQRRRKGERRGEREIRTAPTVISDITECIKIFTRMPHVYFVFVVLFLCR